MFVFAPELFSRAICWPIVDEAVDVAAFEIEALATAAGEIKLAASDGREAIFCIATDVGAVILVVVGASF